MRERSRHCSSGGAIKFLFKKGFSGAGHESNRHRSSCQAGGSSRPRGAHGLLKKTCLRALQTAEVGSDGRLGCGFLPENVLPSPQNGPYPPRTCYGTPLHSAKMKIHLVQFHRSASEHAASNTLGYCRSWPTCHTCHAYLICACVTKPTLTCCIDNLSCPVHIVQNGCFLEADF